MNTNRDVMYDSDLKMPSGCEVGAASFHTPVSGVQPIHSSEHADMRSKLEHLRERGLSKMHDVQNAVTTRKAMVKDNVQQQLAVTKARVQTRMDDRMMKMHSSMRNSPMKWVGIAAGSGFALGMMGRIAQWKSKKHQHHTPQLVIIESMC